MEEAQFELFNWVHLKRNFFIIAYSKECLFYIVLALLVADKIEKWQSFSLLLAVPCGFLVLKVISGCKVFII